MLVCDAKLLDEFRCGPCCEFCGREFDRTEPHHVVTRGAGGSDVRENVIAVGPHDTPWICRCHQDAQAYLIPRRTQLTMIAHREGRTVDALERFLFALRRAPRGADVQAIRFDVFESAGRESA